MRKNFTSSCVMGALMTLIPFSASADESTGECNVRLSSIAAPDVKFSSPSRSIPVTVKILNPGGVATTGISAKVSLNDKHVFTELLDVILPTSKFTTTTVNLTNALEVEPGQKYNLTIELLPPEGYVDTDPSNNTASVEFTTPALATYPSEWNPETASSIFTATSGYEWDASTGAFSFTGSGWTNRLLRTGVMDIPKDEKACLSLKYKTADQDFFLTVTAVSASGETTVYPSTILEKGLDEYTSLNIPFSGLGEPMVLTIKAAPSSTTKTGSVSFTEISVTHDKPDLACSEILDPAYSQLAVGAPITVRARFENLSGVDIVNPEVSYTYGSKIVKETINATIAGKSTYDYTFETILEVSDEKLGLLNVSCDAEGDTNTANNSVEKLILFYQPKEFPYITDFSDISKWTLVNADNDSWAWGAYTAGDNIVLHYPMTKGAPKDYAYAPAVVMPAGKSRASFYLGGTLGSRVRLLMGKSMDPASMTTLIDAEVSVDGWFTVSTVFDVEEVGIYYFAIECVTSKGQILVDNLYIDRGNDLGVSGVSFDTESGYHKTSSKVTIAVSNFGLEPQSDIEVRYSVSKGDSNSFNAVQTATITDVINPGETYNYTFSEPLDISEPGTSYVLLGEIMTVVGADTQNDRSLGESLTHYAVQTVPYRNGFEDPYRNAQWLMQTPAKGLAWTIQSNLNVHSGKYLLGHTSTQAVQQADEWAFSECIHIPAGEYDFSMFYRTYKGLNATSATYKQNFKIMLGNAAEAQAMTLTIADCQDVIVNGNVYQKLNVKVNVESEGDYYLGFYNSSPKGYGVTYIDDIALVPVTDGLSCDYEADFANAASDWEVYYGALQSWSYSDTEEAMVMERGSYYAAQAGTAGWLVSPKLALEAGINHNIELEYSMTGDAADNLGLGVYYATVNHPDEFVLIKSFEAAEAYSKVSCDLPAFSDKTSCYLALRPVMESAKKDYAVKVKSFAVNHNTDQSGIGEITAWSDAYEVARYDVSGRRVSAEAKGLVIIRMSDGTVRKTVVE